MNNVDLIGRVTKDLELKETKKGIPVTNFPIAVNEYLGKDRGTRTDYPYLTVFGPLAETCVACLEKGSLVGIHGRVQTQKKESAAGNAIFSTDIVVKNIEFLSRPSEETDGDLERALAEPLPDDHDMPMPAEIERD